MTTTKAFHYHYAINDCLRNLYNTDVQIFPNVTADGVGIVRNFEKLIKQNHTKPLGKSIIKVAQCDLKITDF